MFYSNQIIWNSDGHDPINPATACYAGLSVAADRLLLQDPVCVAFLVAVAANNEGTWVCDADDSRRVGFQSKGSLSQHTTLRTAGRMERCACAALRPPAQGAASLLGFGGVASNFAPSVQRHANLEHAVARRGCRGCRRGRWWWWTNVLKEGMGNTGADTRGGKGGSVSQ